MTLDLSACERFLSWLTQPRRCAADGIASQCGAACGWTAKFRACPSRRRSGCCKDSPAWLPCPFRAQGAREYAKLGCNCQASPHCAAVPAAAQRRGMRRPGQPPRAQPPNRKKEREKYTFPLFHIVSFTPTNAASFGSFLGSQKRTPPSVPLPNTPNK